MDFTFLPFGMIKIGLNSKIYRKKDLFLSQVQIRSEPSQIKSEVLRGKSKSSIEDKMKVPQGSEHPD